MKKLLILSSLCFFILNAATAQDADAKKALRNAKSALSSFNIGGSTDEVKLQEAIDAIEVAIKDELNTALSSTWALRGDIYNAVVNQHMTSKILDPEHKILDENSPIKAYESYKMALEKASKKFESKDALKGLSESTSNLNTLGLTKYDAQDYVGAYASFKAMLEIHELLEKNGEKTVLSNPEDYNNQLYITGLAAMYSENMEAAGNYFLKLRAANFSQPAIFDVLYKLNLESKPTEALAYLTEGREKFPDDLALLFTEINHYLKANQLDILESKLKLAIEKEPNNVSLYYTLGRVYSDASVAKKAAGDLVAAESYFNQSLEQYSAALTKKEDFYEAMYSIGELYYNRAALVSQEMQSITGNTKADNKRYEELKDKMFAEFEKALPYFQNAEKVNPNDINTLVALSEIYARKSDYNTVSEIKARLQKVQEGGKNETSYFSNK
jgi:hypothetical protein